MNSSKNNSKSSNYLPDRNIPANGPAIWGGCVTRRNSGRPLVPVPNRRSNSAGKGGYGTCFCRHGTNFIEHYACRGTSLIGAANLSPVTKLGEGTGAVSRYNLSRSKKYVKVQDLNCGQMRALPTEAERRWVSGCNNHYKAVLGAGAKAKTVTNNLPILSVLAVVLI